MRLLPPSTPSPRLLSTAAAEYRSRADGKSNAKLSRSSFWSGNGFAIFVGLGLGGLLVCGVSTVLITRHSSIDQVAPARLVPVAPIKSTILPAAPVAAASASAAPKTTPEPEVAAETIHVTSIALGHPRLAVINRQEVTEGDWVYVDTGSSHLRLRLRVIKIADGQVELTLGRRVIAVPLAQMKLKPAR